MDTLHDAEHIGVSVGVQVYSYELPLEPGQHQLMTQDRLF
nr:MAG TPA: hypothetical protein [Caudoviricetes sp.]